MLGNVVIGHFHMVLGQAAEEFWRKTLMRALIAALATAGLVVFSLQGIAADEGVVKTAPNPDKPGRAIEEGTVKTKPDPDKPGRAIEEGVVKAKPDPNKPGRAVEQ